MSQRQPSPEARSRYIEGSRDLWAQHKDRKDSLRTSGMDWPEIFADDTLMALEKRARQHDNTCPECGGTQLRMENYDMAWHEADLVCEACDTYVRMWDAG